MAATEGTIQFAYDLEPPAAEGAGVARDLFADLAAWRSILAGLGLIGQAPGRYGGYAYGNLSARIDDSFEFLITASQTGGEGVLLPEHLVRITHCNLDRFWVEAQGYEPPSSESLSHAMIYQNDPRARFVFHVHSTEIWQARESLGLPQTAPEVSYGSPAMAANVHNLLQKHQSRPLVFATAGHEDGVFATGYHARDCGGLLVSYLAKARTIALTDG